METSVLIIDDDRQAREFYRDMLEAEGFAVVEANNGAEALLWLRGERAEIVLLDLDMPVMDGRSFLEYRARDIRIREIPVVVVLSQLEDPGLREAILQLGVDLLLQKPVRQEELLSGMRQALATPRIRDVQRPTRTQEAVGRQDPRVAFTVPIRVWAPSSPETFGTLRDLSAGGLGAYLPHRLPHGEMIIVRMDLGGHSLALRGIVKWGGEVLAAVGYRHGIRFTEKQDDSLPLHAYSFFSGYQAAP